MRSWARHFFQNGAIFFHFQFPCQKAGPRQTVDEIGVAGAWGIPKKQNTCRFDMF